MSRSGLIARAWCATVLAVSAAVAMAFAATPALASYKVRLEYVRTSTACDQPGVFFGAENVSGSGSTPVLSAGRTDLTLGGYPASAQVRVVPISGAAVMTMPGSNPTGGETKGVRVQAGDRPICVPIGNGQVMAFTEAADAPTASSPLTGVTLANHSGTITSGGTAQQLMAANANRHGWAFQNQSTDVCWIRDMGPSGTANATQDQNSLRVAAGSSYEPNRITGDAVSVICPTTGDAFYDEEW